MLKHPTLDKLRQLKLVGMAAAFTEMEEQNLGTDLIHAEWLALLVDRKEDARSTRRLESLTRTAGLRNTEACPEDVDYKSRRGLDSRLFKSLLTVDWVRRGHNLIITGPSGVGKTWLACVLGTATLRTGERVIYRRLHRLLGEFERAHGDGSFHKLFRKLSRTKLVILDDWGPDRLTAPQRRDLLEIVEERNDRGSILITSQLPVTSWHEIIGEQTIGDAIVDRVVSNAHLLELDGESLRRKKPKLTVPEEDTDE